MIMPMQGSVISPAIRVRTLPGPGWTRLAGRRVSTIEIGRAAPNTGNQASAGMPIYGLGEDTVPPATGWGTTLTQGVMSLVGGAANLLAIKDDQKAAAREADNARAEAQAVAARSADAQRAAAAQEATLVKLAQAQAAQKSSMTPWLIIGGLAAAAAVVGLVILRKPKGKR